MSDQDEQKKQRIVYLRDSWEKIQRLIEEYRQDWVYSNLVDRSKIEREIEALHKKQDEDEIELQVLISSDQSIPASRNSERIGNSSLRVFLCHSSNDKQAVRKLYHQLGKENWIDLWLDEERLLPGEKWDLEIRRAVKATDIVIVCLSNGSINKEGYIQKEIKYVLDVADEKPEGTIFVIPLKLEPCEVPERLIAWQWVNYYEEGSYKRVMLSLQKRASTLGIQEMPGL